MCQEKNAVKTQNVEISDPTQLAECFNDYFINVGPDIAKTIDKSDRNFMDYITKAISKLNFQAVSESTVQRLLLSLNPRINLMELTKFQQKLFVSLLQLLQIL